MSFMVNYYKKESNDMMILKNKGFILRYKSVIGCFLPILPEQIFLPDKNVATIDLIDQKSGLLPRRSRCIDFVYKRSLLLIFPKFL